MCIAFALTAYGYSSCTNSRVHMSVFGKILKALVEYLPYIANTTCYKGLLRIDFYHGHKFFTFC